MRCPVCGSGSKAFLSRRNVPVQQNFLCADQGGARAAPRGDLEMAVCERCGFIHNAAFDPKRVSYGREYDNAQTHSPGFVEYLKGRARRVLEEAGEHKKNIVEVGCGNGYFLRLLVQAGSEDMGYGFDPSFSGAPVQEGGRLRLESRYFDRDCAHVAADVVICRHVIEHVKYPLDLLMTIRNTLVNSPRARIFLETPCVEWILRNGVFWDFFYEHCSLFSEASLAGACRASGYRVDRVEHTFGGQYLWLEATITPGDRLPPFKSGNEPDKARNFAQAEQRVREQWAERLAGLLRSGARTAVWGAGAKGATFCNLIDPEGSLIDCVVDVNPNKQGKFIPGSGHPIVGHRQLVSRAVDTAILMNPNYESEVRALLNESAVSLSLIC